MYWSKNAPLVEIFIELHLISTLLVLVAIYVYLLMINMSVLLSLKATKSCLSLNAGVYSGLGEN